MSLDTLPQVFSQVVPQALKPSVNRQVYSHSCSLLFAFCRVSAVGYLAANAMAVL